MTKNVLHIYSSWTAGGAEKLMLSLASGLEKRGIKNFIAAPPKSYLTDQARKLGLFSCPVIIKGSFDSFGLFGLWRIIKKNNIGILHAHQGKVFWPCVFMKWLKPELKVVFHRHAQLPHKFYSRTHYCWADRVIAISKIIAKELAEREKVPSGKIRVVYNGTDFERFNANVSGKEVREKYQLGKDPVIGTVAAMNKPKGKGQEYLIEAAQIVRQRFPQSKYLIVGDGLIKENLKNLSKKLGVSDKVIFTGYQEDVEKYIAAMDIFCFLSWDTEGFGQVMVEAQAMGKPVIGTDIGGIPETFQDGECGFLIPAKNSELLAGILVMLLEEESKRINMGRAAEKFVKEKFSLDSMVQNVLNVYEEML